MILDSGIEPNSDK